MRNLLIALTVLLIAACSDVNPPAVVSLTPEQQLVVLDTGGPLPKQDETIVRGYKALLDQLSAKYPGISSHDLADVSVRGQGALEKSGIHVSLYDILSGLNEASPNGLDNLSYKDAVATYATLRVKGLEHDKAVKGLRSFLDVAKASKPKDI